MSDTVLSLWRYPVKSMQGEEINATLVTPKGLLGDRAYALMDAEDGKTVTAKNPKKWPAMFQFRAAFAEPSMDAVPPVWITTPDGTVLDSRQPDLNQVLSRTLGRAVVFADSPPAKPHLDEYWPDEADVPGLPHSDDVTDENTLENTFFDLAILHLLSTATIDSLRGVYPSGRFEARRFRPNILVDAGPEPYAENAWIGKTISIGDEVRAVHHRPLPALRDDDPAAERPSQRPRHPARGGAEQRRQRRRLRQRPARRHHPPGRPDPCRVAARSFGSG